MNKPFSEYTDSVVTVHHHDFGITVRVDRMIGKANLVTLSGGVNHKVWNETSKMSVKVERLSIRSLRTIVKIEQKGAHIFVVNFSSSISLVLGDYFTTVFGNEFILLYCFFQKYSPTRNIGRGHKQMLACKPQQHRLRIKRFKSLGSDVRNPRWTLTFLQVILETSWWSAPHVPHKSGSHSRTAKKQGHCLVLHWALHRQPGNRFWPDREI